MCISNAWVASKENQERVLTAYKSLELPTVREVANQLGTTVHNVSRILSTRMSKEEFSALKALRYSKSKTGVKNPMKTRLGELHHNWKGECEDGYGYLTCIHGGERQFVHRVLLAMELGMKKLPSHLDVHHIDGNTRNNTLDNLALVTHAGHHNLHYLQAEDSLLLRSRKLTLVEALKCLTSP